jgi:hypothetical protein
MAFIYLTLDDVLYIHTQQIKHFGGVFGVRNRGLIETWLTDHARISEP